MGMCLALNTLSDENVSRVLADPPLIWRVLEPDDPEAYERARLEKQPGFLAKLFKKASAVPTEPEAFNLSEAESFDTDLDKAWHGIHYLLTGTAWEGDGPLNFLVGGGREVGGIEVGYGPARVFGSEEVKAIHAGLQGIDEATLRSRFNPSEMMKLQIYPEIWDRDPAQDDPLGYCSEYFGVLKSFVGHAAEKGLGLVVYIS